MKKIALAIIIISLNICFIGCGKQNKDDALKEQNTVDAMQSTEENKSEITIDEAREIALRDANLTSDMVSFILAEPELDNGIRKYQINFTYNNIEYDYEIAAADGSILSNKVEVRNNLDQPTQQAQQTQTQPQPQPEIVPKSNDEISAEEAKNIALKHANLSSDQVSFLKAELEVDHGVRKYEIDFTYNNKEYDYEINPSTGDIISHEIE